MSDQSIDVLADAHALSGAEYMLSLDSGEAYRLMISLQEAFKQGTDQSGVPEGLLGASWHPSQGDRR